jgi:hypothetical protein
MRNLNTHLQINIQKYLKMKTIMMFLTVKIKQETNVKLICSNCNVTIVT